MLFRFAPAPAVTLSCALVCQLALSGPSPAESLSESDQILMGMMENACQTRDYHAFFEVIARSEVIRRKYTAAKVEVSEVHPGDKAMVRQVPGAEYADFPVTLRDYTYVPAPAVAGNDPDMGLMLEFNQASDERVAVEWTRVHYVQPTGEGDELGTPMHLDGTPWVSGDMSDGTLLIYPTETCFELVADTRYLSK
jgi:hypothetical protein